LVKWVVIWAVQPDLKKKKSRSYLFILNLYTKSLPPLEKIDLKYLKHSMWQNRKSEKNQENIKLMPQI